MIIKDPAVKALLLQELYTFAKEKYMMDSPRNMYILLRISKSVLLEEAEAKDHVRIAHRSSFLAKARKNRPLLMKIIPYLRLLDPKCKVCKHIAAVHNKDGACTLVNPRCTCTGLVIRQPYE